MNKISDSILEVYAEGRTRKMFVGTLKWTRDADIFEFKYDRKYLKMRNTIAVGPELPLNNKTQISRGKLFPSFQDRIPSKGNPAYEEYCAAAGVSPKEKNPIVLLGTIGRRGPSAFVFEPVVASNFDASHELAFFRKKHFLSLHEVALALDLNEATLQRIQAGKSKDPDTSRMLEIFLTIPEALRYQLRLTSRTIHRRTETTFLEYCDQLTKLEKSVPVAEKNELKMRRRKSESGNY